MWAEFIMHYQFMMLIQIMKVMTFHNRTLHQMTLWYLTLQLSCLKKNRNANLTDHRLNSYTKTVITSTVKNLWKWFTKSALSIFKPAATVKTIYKSFTYSCQTIAKINSRRYVNTMKASSMKNLWKTLKRTYNQKETKRSAIAVNDQIIA